MIRLQCFHSLEKEGSLFKNRCTIVETLVARLTIQMYNTGYPIEGFIWGVEPELTFSKEEVSIRRLVSTTKSLNSTKNL